MKNPLRLITLAFLVLGLNGCGLKGPLYYPPAEKTTAKPKPARTVTPTPVQTANPGGASTSAQP
ncbi:LPS translocon maturation chaperone LptM [Sodalis sp. C49]|uniref:LPS translocon maturation chaperone LptM n=1 Tax=unclassified Sodalis (in: enterobacteria) TaxID=2636512 RepID=UPI003965C884